MNNKHKSEEELREELVKEIIEELVPDIPLEEALNTEEDLEKKVISNGNILKKLYGLYKKIIKKRKFSSTEEKIRHGFKECMIRYMIMRTDPDHGLWDRINEVKMPLYGHLNGSKVEPLKILGDTLNKINGVSSNDGVLFDGQTWDGTKINWRLEFDTYEDLQHFLWAGCFRYFPLTHNPNWLLTLDNADPNYSKPYPIKVNLGYRNLKAKRKEWERDVLEFAEGVEKYASEQDEIEKKLNEKK